MFNGRILMCDGWDLRLCLGKSQTAPPLEKTACLQEHICYGYTEPSGQRFITGFLQFAFQNKI